LYLRLKKYDLARSDFQTALDLDGEFAAALDGRGRVSASALRHDEAIKDYDRPSGSPPKWPNIISIAVWPITPRGA